MTDLEELENQLENVRLISLIQAKRRDDDRDSRSDDMTRAGELTDFQLPLKEEVETLQSTSIRAFSLQAI